MKVFISWSGDTSRRIAMVLSDWLPNVIQTIETYITVEDTDKGTRWFSEISEQLEETDFGIICVTPENKEAPWIHFEAGALAKKIDKSKVCPLLTNLKFSDLVGPLAQFQACNDTKDNMFGLVRSLNKELEKEIDDERLEKAFNIHWPEFEEKLSKAKEYVPVATEPRREEDDILSEILETVRNISRTSQESDAGLRKRSRIVEKLYTFGASDTEDMIEERKSLAFIEKVKVWATLNSLDLNWTYSGGILRIIEGDDYSLLSPENRQELIKLAKPYGYTTHFTTYSNINNV